MAIVGHASLETSLISYYKLDETSGTREDIHGTYDLTANGTGGVDSGTGIISNAASFVSSDSDYLRIVEQTEHAYSGSNNKSVSFWFKATTLSGTRGIVGLYNAGTETGENWLVYTNGTTLTLLVRNLGAAVTWGSALSTGTWYHVVATMDSSNSYQLIVNNGTPATGSGGTGTNTGSLNFQIGCYGNTATGFTNGLVDEVGFWSKKLTGTEITDLYNSGAGLPYQDAGGATFTPRVSFIM